MKCQEVQERLSEYLAKSLDQQGAQAVEGHLSSCPRCSAEAEALARSIQAVGDLPALEPPTDFPKQVMARIQGEPAKRNIWQRLFFPLAIKIPIQAVAILLVSGLTVYLFQMNQQSQMELMRKSALSEQGRAAEPKVRAELELEEDRRVPAEAPMKQKGADEDFSVAGTREGIGRTGEEQHARAGRADHARLEAEKRSAAAPAFRTPAAQSLPGGDLELVLALNEPAEGDGAQRRKLDALIERFGGRPPGSGKKTEGIYNISVPEPEVLRLTIPGSEYSRFKTELASLGTIRSESGVPASSLSDQAAEDLADRTPPPHTVRIKLTILPPEPQD